VRTSPRDAVIADSTPAEIRGRAFASIAAWTTSAAVGPLLPRGSLVLARRSRATFESAVRHLFL